MIFPIPQQSDHLKGICSTNICRCFKRNKIPIQTKHRATTTSLGSIIFGSGIIAFAKTLNVLAQSKADTTDNVEIMSIAVCVSLRLNYLFHQIFWKIIACCASCILALIKFITKYAFTQVAIYGKPFMQAAVATFKLLSHHGVGSPLYDS